MWVLGWIWAAVGVSVWEGGYEDKDGSVGFGVVVGKSVGMGTDAGVDANAGEFGGGGMGVSVCGCRSTCLG